jgi:hypothetical protein
MTNTQKRKVHHSVGNAPEPKIRQVLHKHGDIGTVAETPWIWRLEFYRFVNVTALVHSFNQNVCGVFDQFLDPFEDLAFYKLFSRVD